MIEHRRRMLKDRKNATNKRTGSHSTLGLTMAIIGFAVMMLWPRPVIAALPDTPNQDTWITDGTVNAIAADATAVYIGGSFSTVGPYTGFFAPIDSLTGSPLAVYPRVTGYCTHHQCGVEVKSGVYASVPDGYGGWFIGGEFTYVGGLARKNIAHILNDGTVDPSWNVAPDTFTGASAVYALALSGTTLFAGGQSMDMLALHAATGEALPYKSLHFWPYGTVYALAVSGNTLYVGGKISIWMGDKYQYNIAAMDIANGSVLSWDPDPKNNGDPYPAEVHSLVVSGNTVYAGGEFTSIGGKTRYHLAELDATSGLATSWNANADDIVYALAVDGTTLYAGGKFTTMGSQDRYFMAALDAATGSATPWNPNPNEEVYTLAVSGNTVYAGGVFTSIGGQARNYLAALDAATGLATSWNPNPTDEVDTLAVSGNTVYAGGRFISMGGEKRNNIAALDATTGKATSWNSNANKEVYALALSGNKVYAGGYFTKIGGQARNNIAALNRTTGAATKWNPNGDGPVFALAVSGNTVYAGGMFGSMGGQGRSCIAALDAATGLSKSWSGGGASGYGSSNVSALAVCGNTLYAAGHFTSLGSQQRKYIAALDATTGEATAWNPNADDMVYALAVSGNTVYAGGYFMEIGGRARHRIAALDATTGKATAWNAYAEGSGVFALAVKGRTLCAGGLFDTIGGESRNDLAALDAATGSATSWNPQAEPDSYSSGVCALVVSGSRVYAGGYFNNMGTDKRPSLAWFDEADATGHSISGTVRSGGLGLSGVSVTLSGAADQSTTTDTGGNYSFSWLSDGDYSITPDKAGYAFTPQEQEVTVGGADVTGQDFAVSATLPGAPTEVTASAGNAQATVSFTAPTSDGGSSIISYKVTSTPGGKTATGTSPITVKGLTNGKAYTFKVRATNTIGTGPASSPSNSVTPLGPPKAPTGVTATAGNAQAEVSFMAPSSDGGRPIISYKVTSSPGGKTATDKAGPITVKGLTNGTAYTFKVKATTDIGTSRWSSPSNSVVPVE